MKFHFRLILFSVLFLTASVASAQINSGQARRLIARMAGIELPSSAVRVKLISSPDTASAEVNAEIETAFRLAAEQSGGWSVMDVRVSPDRWEDIGLIATALGSTRSMGTCDAVRPVNGSTGSGPSTRRARCELAELLGVTLPSDEVRIREIVPLGLPLASRPSALVVAILRIDFKLVKEGKSWRVSQLRTGSSDWVSVDNLVTALSREKISAATTELRALASALENYRNEHGFYIVADNQAALVNHLSPRYISKVIRIDPWHRPYEYQGESGRFTLRSVGPDGKQNTADDIVVSK